MITQIDLTAYFMLASAVLALKASVFGATFILSIIRRR